MTANIVAVSFSVPFGIAWCKVECYRILIVVGQHQRAGPSYFVCTLATGDRQVIGIASCEGEKRFGLFGELSIQLAGAEL